MNGLLRPRIWACFLASSGVPSTGSGQAHSATYRSGTPRLRFWILDFGFRIFAHNWWYRTSEFRFRHLFSSSHELLSEFSIRNPHSAIVDQVACPSSRPCHSNSSNIRARNLQLVWNLVRFQPGKTSTPGWGKGASLLRRRGNDGLYVISYTLFVNGKNNNRSGVPLSKVKNDFDDLCKNTNN